MKKVLKRITCILMALVMTFGAEAFGTVTFALQSYDSSMDSTVITTDIVKDTTLLGALKTIVGGGEDITVADLMEYTGEIDLTSYTGISDVTGLGYARAASSIDFSTCKNVTFISDYEFYRCEFTKCKLPDSIEKIGSFAFGYCENLETIDLYEGLKIISDSAFYSCIALDNVTLPAGLQRLGNAAFSMCESLSEVVIPEGLNTVSSDTTAIIGIGGNVYYGCKELTSVTLSSDITGIPAGFLANTTSLTQIDIPDTVYSIGLQAFAGSAITSIDLSGCTYLTEIGTEAFRSCVSLSQIKLNEAIVKIGNNAFYGCYSIPNFDFLGDLYNLTEIGEYAFAGCSIQTVQYENILDSAGKKLTYYSGAESVILPENLISLGKGAFAWNYALETVEFKDFDVQPQEAKTKKIGDYAFAYCSFLTDVKLPEDGNTNINVEVTIGNYAFQSCGMLENINFSSAITSIGDYAFSGCGTYIFYGTSKGLYYCSSVDSVVSDSNTEDNAYIKLPFYSISDYSSSKYYSLQEAYIDMSSLSTVKTTFSSGYEEIYLPYMTIYYCTDKDEAISTTYDSETTNVSVNFAMPYTQYDTFTEGYIDNSKVSTKLSDFLLDDTAVEGTDYYTIYVPTYKNNYMYDCVYYGLESVNLSKNTRCTYIGTHAFENCVNLQKASLPSNLTEIPSYVFDGCYADLYTASRLTYKKACDENTALEWYHGLEKYTFSSAVKNIGSCAFRNCKKIDLDNSLPSKLQTIGDYSFQYCQNIGELKFPSTLTSIGKYAFNNCGFEYIFGTVSRGLTKVDLEDCSELATIGEYAFSYCPFDSFVMNLSSPCETISKYTLYGCLNLTKVILSDNITSICEAALGVNPSLRTVNIPAEAVIDQKAFYGTRTIQKVTYFTYTMPSFTLRVDNENVSVSCNGGTTTLALNTATIGSNFVSTVDKVKIGDYEYTWDDETGTLEGTEFACATISADSTKTNGVTHYAITITGGDEPTEGPQLLNVELNLQFIIGTIDSVSYYLSSVGTATYSLEVVDTPCETITCDDVYIDYSSTKTYTISPEILPADTSDEITWQVETNSDNIVLTPSTDGRMATVKSAKNGFGGSLVKIYAGTREMCSFYVYINAPASKISYGNGVSKIDLLYGNTYTGTMILNYTDAYDSCTDDERDGLIFTSADESIATVELGSSTYDASSRQKTVEYAIKAVSIGTTTITAKTRIGNQTKTITVNVTSDSLEVKLTDADGNEVVDGDTIYLQGKATQTLSYAFSENVNSYALSVTPVVNSPITTAIDSGKKTIKITGKQAGTQQLTFYPSFADSDNGITINVVVLAPTSSITLSNNKEIELLKTENVFLTLKNVFGEETDDYKKISSITNSTIEFTSSNPEIATVDNYGNVTVVATSDDVSTVLITCSAYSPDGTLLVQKTCKVKPKHSEHSYKAVSVVAPTIFAKGYTVYQCTDCGETIKSNYKSEIKKVTVGKYTYKITNNSETAGTVTLVKVNNKNIKKAVIPATVKISGYKFKVTAIGAKAFANCKKLKQVTIGKNVTTINKKAFYNCKKLKKIIIKSKKIKTIKAKAFKNIAKKAVFAVPKAKLKAYKKLLTKKNGFRKTMKVKKK